MTETSTWHVYLLRCSDETIYTGCTGNLEHRMKALNDGQVSYTKSKLIFEFITFISFTGPYKAYQFEKYSESGSGKAFMKKRLV